MRTWLGAFARFEEARQQAGVRNRRFDVPKRHRPRSPSRWLGALAVLISMCGAALVPAPAVADSQCPAADPTYNGTCGPTFTLPSWGDAAGWVDPSQYSTIQLADVLGLGRDQLIARGSAGIEIWEFDTGVGQWRQALGADGKPMILTAFADPPPLTVANPSPPDTDWTLPQYYTTIQTGDLLGTGRPQIIGRSAHGVIVLSYTPGPNGAAGTWSESDTGAFIDGQNLPAGWYQSIGTANLRGGPADELYGIDTSFDLKVVSWSGSDWEVLPGDGGSFPPGVAGNTLMASPPIVGRQELWFESAGLGLTGVRLQDTGNWLPSAFLGNGSFGDPYWQQVPYSATLRVPDLLGPDTPVIAGRGVDGLDPAAHLDKGWQPLPELQAFGDDRGFNEEKYWRTITYADLDGDGRAEVLARGPQGVSAYDLASDGWDQMPGGIDLEDDPWGSDQAYYGTFRAGDVDGDGRDDLIARGPYGIRTWFYNRPNQPGFGPYLPTGYPAFPGTSPRPGVPDTGPAAAYNAVNTLAREKGVLSGDESSVRAVWSADATSGLTDLGPLNTRLTNFDTSLAGPLVGNCGPTPQRINPLQYASCTPPSDTTGFSPDDWTTVLNALLSEVYDAQQVVTFYTQVASIRDTLFLGQNVELPAIGTKLGLAGAATADGSFDVGALMAGIIGSLGTIIGDEFPGLSTGLSVSSYAVSMIPSASPSVTSGPFAGTYSALQDKWATYVSEAAGAYASLNFQVRSDRNLMRLISQLSAPGAPWDTSSVDEVGLVSAGNQAFTLWAYKSLLPGIYARYDISNCQSAMNAGVPPFTDPNFPFQYFDCTGPMNLNPVFPSPSPWVTADASVINAFQSVEALPQPGAPCGQHLQSLLFDCAFKAPDPDIVSAVSDPVSTGCIHQPGKSTTTWKYGCSLGIPPSALVDPSTVLNSVKENWNLSQKVGTPFPFASTLSGSTATATAARAARAGTGARGHVVHLTGTMPWTRHLDLRQATVAVDRVLSVPDANRDLVKRRASTRLRAGGPRTRRLGSIRLRQPSRGRFRSREPGRNAPRISLNLTPRGSRSMVFDLTVANVAIPRLSDVCGHGLAALRITPRPFALAFQMRVRPAHGRSLGVSTMSNFACRYARSGAVRGIKVAKRPRTADFGPRLSLRLRYPRRLTVGRPGTLTATVRNDTSRTAQDVYAYAVMPPGLRVVGSAPRARITGRRLAWRFAGLRRHRSRTVRLQVQSARAGTAPRCSSVHARAMLRRTTKATACFQVGPARPVRFTG